MLSLERNSGLFKKKKKKNEADESQISGGGEGKVEENLEGGWRCEVSCLGHNPARHCFPQRRHFLKSKSLLGPNVDPVSQPQRPMRA